MTGFVPFADDTAAATFGGLTMENGRDRIVLSGEVEITRDTAGLAQARALLALLTDTVAALSGDAALPQHVAPAKAKPAKVVRNPFG